MRKCILYNIDIIFVDKLILFLNLLCQKYQYSVYFTFLTQFDI